MTFQFIPLFQNEIPGELGESVWLWRSDAALLPREANILSGDEIARISRLVDGTQKRLLAAHLSSRKQLLSQLVDADPASISIEYSGEGRPFLPLWADVRISFADSNGWSALAFSLNGSIGVDVETVRPLSWEPMLPMISDADEALEIRKAMACAATPVPFFRCWTAKEAVLKAEGRGMRGDARRVRLPVDYIRGETNSVKLIKDGMSYQLDVSETNHTIVARARYP